MDSCDRPEGIVGRYGNLWSKDRKYDVDIDVTFDHALPMASESLDETIAGVRVNRVDGVVRVTLDRPAKKNAVLSSGWARLRDVLDTIEVVTDRVLILTGADETFCSGADLSDDPGDTHPVDSMRVVGQACRSLFDCPIPTIAAVDGAAVGAGMNLALACDFVISTDRARFSEIFVDRSLSVDFGGSWLLPRLIGMARAKQLIMLGEFISGTEAHRIGLIHQLVRPDDLQAAASRLAGRLAAKSPRPLSMSKSLINGSFEIGLGRALENEAWVQAINLSSDETKEAFAAFAEGREPTSPSGSASPPERSGRGSAHEL